MENRGLLEYRDRLGALPRGAQRLCILQRRRGIPGIGAETLAIGIEFAARVDGMACFGFLAERARDVRRSVGLAAAHGQRQERGR